MPVTRNRLSNQKPSSGTTGYDGAESRSQSRNSNEGESNNSPEDAPAPRMLRDRASLAAKSASHNQSQQQQQQPPQTPQQQSQQNDGGKTTPTGRDTPSIIKKVLPKGLPPTRVLSRRSSFRPQSLLKRETLAAVDAPDAPKNDNATPSNTTSVTPNEAKRPRREESKVPETGLDLTKRTVDPGRTSRVSETYSRIDKTSCPVSLINKDKSNPAVRISLPSNPTPTSSHVPTNANGSQVQGAKRFGLIPLGAKIASELRSHMASNSSMTSLNSSNKSANNRSTTQPHSQSLLLSEDRRHVFNILIAVTGSVATIKLTELIKKLHLTFPQAYTNKITNRTCSASISVRVIMTEHSKHFVNKNEISKCIAGKIIEVYDDADEWLQWSKMGDPILHIELRKWADLCLIAPLDANTMAKLANGLCDNLLTCVVRAWDTSKRLIYCPAMNVHMYNHPITKEQLCKLQSFGYLRVDCIEKTLACGDVGLGAMASVDTIVEKVIETLLRPVPRLISPTKPLLTQQPTYQIMSTSGDRPATTSGNSSASNLLDRFKASEPVSLRAMNCSVRSLSSNGTSSMSFPKSSTPQSTGFNLLFQKQQPPKVTGHDANNDLKQGRPNFVQSLKNLKAINPDLSADANGISNHLNEYEGDDDDDDDEGEEEDDDDDDDDDMDDYIDDCGMDLSSPEADNCGYDLDPSRLLEQSLITTDDSLHGRQPRGGSVNSFGNHSSASNNFNANCNPNRSDPFTPFFNTSKFLTLCYVKERNCFNCAICKNDYKNRKSMSRHLREQHVQGNIYQCEPCGVGFKRREKLMKHNRDRHGINIEPKP